MKKNLFTLSILSIFLISMIIISGIVSAAGINTLKDYENSINYTCEQPEDCEIKDVRNCCGYHPECVNKNSIVNASLVKELCEHGAQTGLCGYKDIKSCKCEKNKCIGSEKNVTDYNYCERDTDCACGTNIQTGECFIGNKKYVNETKQCPDYCSGFAANLINRCENNKCISSNKNLPGKDKVKILPETASLRARERLGELGFNITLKEVGTGNEKRFVYETKAKKEGKLFGFLKVKADISAEIDAETGEVTKVHKPWWSFIATGI
ncbi:hypothetical protein J4429_00730 [Candidatus Pacearchaeota archaeon]|nr:hypothetical protein [Candidatus Pacearchaeota archaeon]